MTDNEKQSKIISIIRAECKKQNYQLKKFILFGSRAQGSPRPDSDWDFLIVLNKPISWKEKMKLWIPINRNLAEIGCTADIIIKYEKDFERDKTDTGKVTYYANKLGITV
ncbi:MAG: nucleotidyltransferase domain-containing protein [Brevinematales bacterium]|nr:nucleotidyltransferase domain-containing protein [Brevinematales bacterium]